MGQGAKISGASDKCFVAGRDGTTIFVCEGTHHSALYSDELHVAKMNWIAGEPPIPLQQSGNSMSAWCRTRHLQPLSPCTISW
jgi:tRNA U34 2-thiouridine synthase MnmA/TrmU